MAGEPDGVAPPDSLSSFLRRKAVRGQNSTLTIHTCLGWNDGSCFGPQLKVFGTRAFRECLMGHPSGQTYLGYFVTLAHWTRGSLFPARGGYDAAATGQCSLCLRLQGFLEVQQEGEGIGLPQAPFRPSPTYRVETGRAVRKGNLGSSDSTRRIADFGSGAAPQYYR